MSEPYFTILWAKTATTESGDPCLIWNAEFFDSTGFRHFTDRGYRLTATDVHSPAAASAFGAAKSAGDLKAAVLLDAQRCLAEFEARLVPAQDAPQDIPFEDNEKTYDAAGVSFAAPVAVVPDTIE